MEGGIVCRWPSTRVPAQPRTAGATRELLEYLITRGTEADLDVADPAWIKNPPTDDGALEWYNQFGDGWAVLRGRAELLRLVVELHLTSPAPAASALDPGAWFEEWVELPHPCLGSRSPAELVCSPQGLEAAKVVLRSLQSAAREPGSAQSISPAGTTYVNLPARLREIVRWRQGRM
jgi:hypothetical protein